MYRIDNSTAATSLPTPGAVGPNPNGYFTDGDPATNTPATVVDDDWANAVQEEICEVITGAGITLSKTDRTQLYQALLKVPGKNILVFTTSGATLNGSAVTWTNGGNYTFATNCRIEVICTGGGGGGPGLFNALYLAPPGR